MAYGRKRTYRKKRTMSARRTTPFKRVNTRALVAKAKTKQLVKLIKGVTLKQSETCYKTRAVTANNLKHDLPNGITIWSPTAVNLFPTQGLTDGERRGDEIITQGIMYRGVYQIPWDRRNTVFKLFYLPYNSVQGNPLDYSQLYHNISGDGMLDPIQTDRWPGIRYLGKFRLNSTDQTGASQDAQDKTIHVKRWIPLRKKVKFLQDGSANASNLKEECLLICVPYDSITTLVTDTVITRSEHTFTLYYKDP